jgi:hypothetical protein
VPQQAPTSLRNRHLINVESIDAIVTAAYDGISGPAGKKRDWDRERSLYFPGARLIPTAMKAGVRNVDLAPQILDIDGFIARVEPFFEENGFYEKEIARRTEQFGNIAHVWSIYACRAVALRRRESRHNEGDPEPFMRGINPENIRRWIVNIYWQQESAENPIPQKYLK